MDVLVTGAHTKYGAWWADILAERHDVTCLGAEARPGHDSVVADRRDFEAIRPAFDGTDAVVDLPATGDASAGWEPQEATIAGTYNFLEAAREAGVERYVVGSSNKTVEGYEVDHAPDLYDPDYEFTVDHTVPPRPLNLYGVSRLFAEQLGRCYAESRDWQVGRHVVEERAYPERVYVLRWGSVRLAPGMDHPYSDAEYGVEHGLWERGSEQYDLAVARMKATWCSGRDLTQLLEAVLADETVTFDVFYAVSDNDRNWFDLEHARRVLGYEPRDNGEAWSEPPA